MNLEAQEQEFEKEAREIILDLKLSKLSAYGTFEIVGSMLLHTMLYPDIDITVRSTPENEKGYWETTQSLLKHPQIEKLILMDTRTTSQAMYPRGLYIGGSYKGKQNIWNLDIWFFRILESDEPNNNEWLKNNITDQQRKSILLLKDAAIKSGKYKTNIFSMDVYDAVMKHDITTIQEFNDYLKSIEKAL